MIIGRVIGWILIIAALAALAYDALGWARGDGFVMHTAGEVWYAVNRDTLNMLQAGIQRRIWPYLWDPVIVTVLLWPACLVLGVPGVVLAWAFRRRGDRRRR